MRANNPNATTVLTCPFDTGEPKAEFHVLSAFLLPQRNEFLDHFDSVAKRMENKEAKPSEYTQLYKDIAKAGLKKLVNVYDGQEKELTVNGQVTDQLLNALAEIREPGSGYDSVLTWLGIAIWSLNTLSEKQKKTSPALVKSLNTGDASPESSTPKGT